MLLRKLKFFQKVGHTPRSRSQVKKNLGFHGKVVTKKTKNVGTHGRSQYKYVCETSKL